MSEDLVRLYDSGEEHAALRAHLLAEGLPGGDDPEVLTYLSDALFTVAMEDFGVIHTPPAGLPERTVSDVVDAYNLRMFL
ncbi:hypothetical protein ND748_03000 [Frankia sp. AiPs1]|uniref:hypothetical protein n=1 Tax=Frankia sp. AiPs1 TaxID=573493 RepID=UPI0020436788|nr:hypothetical protein [Frankia sp. AiPs1]MCM3920645.1 hypothetical protein [Frankia sp. AiPs1]